MTKTLDGQPVATGHRLLALPVHRVIQALAPLRTALLTLLFITSTTAMALDLTALWNFKDPAASEARFRGELAQAEAQGRSDDALVLRTQIARSYSLRRDYTQARRELAAMEPQLARAGAEVQVRHQLELGRTWVSAIHKPEEVDDAIRASARSAFMTAWQQAKAARLDALAIDAIHMLVFVDSAPADQLKWNREALAVVLASDQPDAQRWQASVRNNLGMALHGLQRYDEALAEFQRAVALREAQAGEDAMRGTPPEPVRVARWMVAWTLRTMGRNDEALAMQLALEQAGDAAGEPDPYVFEELETLYRARGDIPRAEHYAARRKAAQGS